MVAGCPSEEEPVEEDSGTDVQEETALDTSDDTGGEVSDTQEETQADTAEETQADTQEETQADTAEETQADTAEETQADTEEEPEVQEPYCGDGEVNRQEEECDDGNDIDDDECSNECVRNPGAAVCEPCETNEDCGFESDLCLEYEIGLFCGMDCSQDDCPEGYSCMAWEDAMQCAPDSQCLPCVDTDLDGVCDDDDPCPLDYRDDYDQDGVCDTDDVCPNGDDRVDVDQDGIPDDCDDVIGEICDDQRDNDNDELIDCQDPDCSGALNCEPTAPGTCADPLGAILGVTTGSTANEYNVRDGNCEPSDALEVSHPRRQ